MPPPDDLHEHELPAFSRQLNGWFMLYVRRFFRRHFHALRVLGGENGKPGTPDIAGEPVIFYTNHPGWWDPLVFLLLAGKCYPDRLSYGPIDATALGKYRFMERIGFLGIERDSRRGATRFLRMARAARLRRDVIFWITSQGAFADPRTRPPAIRPGVGHAVASSGRGLIVPVAVEYPFWSERLPEALVAFGPTMRIADADQARDAKEWTAVLETALLGGAIATNVRVDNPLISHELFVIYLGVLVWLGLWLRDPRVRALLPLRGLMALPGRRGVHSPEMGGRSTWAFLSITYSGCCWRRGC